MSVKIRGLVQGVFFRETVRQIAGRHAVAGFVRNIGSDVLEIEAEAEPDVLKRFVDDVLSNPPRFARVDEVSSTTLHPQGSHGFSVARSLPAS